MQTLNNPKEICPNQLLSIPIDGRWIWDEKNKELVYQSQDRLNNEKINKTEEGLKIDIRTGLIKYRKQSRLYNQIIKTTKDPNNNKITLMDVIQAALNVMSDTFYIPIEFEEYLSKSIVHEYLLYLLNYFYWFFEIMNNAVPKKGQHIDRSETEKTRICFSYAHLLVSLRELNCKYARLLLGIDLKEYHHMNNGDLFYSCANIDRTIYESLFIFSTYFIWITYYRENFDLIRIELARLFRSGADLEILTIPTTENLKNHVTIGSMYQDKLLDCTELFSKSITTKTAIEKPDEVEESKVSIQRASSMVLNSDENPQRRLKNRLRNEKSVYHQQKHKLFTTQRQNRIRDILTKQLKHRNSSLSKEEYHRLNKDKKVNEQSEKKKDIEIQARERDKMKRKRLTIQRLLKTSTHDNTLLLSPPENPLDDARIGKQKQIILPKVQFVLKENIGIIGQPYTDFDSIRLTLKPHNQDNIVMPSELLITLPNELNTAILDSDQKQSN